MPVIFFGPQLTRFLVGAGLTCGLAVAGGVFGTIGFSRSEFKEVLMKLDENNKKLDALLVESQDVNS